MAFATAKTRWYQFSLRSLLLFVTLCAIACSWLAVKIGQAKQRQHAVGAIKNLGGDVTYDWEVDKDFRRVASPKPPGPKWLRSLLGEEFFARVVEIRLDSSTVTDADIGLLKRFPQLQGLSLESSRISDAGLQQIEEQSDLRWLSLAGTQVSDAGLEHVKRLTRIECLYLYDTRISDAGIEYLTRLSRLHFIFVNDTNVTSAGAERLLEVLPHCQILLGRGNSKTALFWADESGKVHWQ